MSEKNIQTDKAHDSTKPKDIRYRHYQRWKSRGGRLPVISEFSKVKSTEELGKYFKDTFKVNESEKGLYINEKEVSSWCSDKNIHLAYFLTSTREDDTQILNWDDAASRINELLEKRRITTITISWKYKRSTYKNNIFIN